MRISTHPADPGYLGKGSQAVYRVFLDGEEISDRVQTADDAEGMAVCYVLREDGSQEGDPQRPGRALTEIRRGRVTIVKMPA